MSKQEGEKARKKSRVVFVLVNLGVAIVAFGVLATAWKIQPNVKGFGTHRQLNMAACGFLEKTGYPCPTCGMTTAFAHTVRFQLIKGFKAQPGGMVLALVCMLALPFCLWQGLTGTSIEKVMAWLNFYAIQILWITAIVFLLAWGYKALTV